MKSNICDYYYVEIFVRGNIIIIGDNENQVALKNCAPFIKWIANIDGKTTNNAEDLDLVKPICNLIEYCSNHPHTTCCLWSYSKDEKTYFDNFIVNTNDFKSFKCKVKWLGNTEADGLLVLVYLIQNNDVKGYNIKNNK